MRPLIPLILGLLLTACVAPADDDTAPADDDDTTPTDDDDSAPADDDDSAPADDLPSLWFQLRVNLQPDDNLPGVLALMDRAAAAGYDGMVLADFKLSLLHRDGLLADTYRPNLATVLEHAGSLGISVVPAVFPFGYSEGILSADPNLAESLPVLGAGFVVSGDGTRLEHVPADLGFSGGGLESWTGSGPEGWSWVDEPGSRVVQDSTLARSGTSSARVEAGSGNARLVQALDVPPHRQVHVRFWMRTEGFSAGWFHAMVYDTDRGLARNFEALGYQADQDWTAYDVVANSGDSASLSLYLGFWDSTSGTAWFDDVEVRETALVNLVRRPGAPLVARDAGGGQLVEGSDLDPIVDPLMGVAPYAGNYDVWHEPPEVTIPDGSALSPGDPVTLDFEAAQPVHGWQVGACLSEPAVDVWMEDNAAAVLEAFPGTAGAMLGYDEIRHANTCNLCRGRGLAAGELLADHVQRSAAVLRDRRPGLALLYWSDMFDPNHNAHADYYLAEGDFAGSWEGLPGDAVVVNWLRSAKSVAWFDGIGHRQILAGYYDSGDGAASGAADRALADGAEDVLGFMYTTWTDDWDELEAYADAILAR